MRNFIALQALRLFISIQMSKVSSTIIHAVTDVPPPFNLSPCLSLPSRPSVAFKLFGTVAESSLDKAIREH